MSPAARPPRRVLLKLLIALAIGAVFFEVGLRALLTSPWTADSALAREIGSPARFAYTSQDLYWRFVHRLSSSEAPIFEPPYDPALGWTWPGIAPLTYAHAEEAHQAGRRPVLLFGDSYSACLTTRQECFEGLMERSALASRCLLLNYGVCGYGFDQTCLLARATLGLFEDRDPVIVIGVLVDDDLNRMLLSLREYPKPRLRVEEGRIVAPRAVVPSSADWKADPPPLPASWAWTWLRHAASTDPTNDPGSAERREMEQLTRALLRELVADLRERELDFFFLLFHTEQSFSTPVEHDWRTRLMRDALGELDAPWYDVRDELARRLAQDGGTIGDFYIPVGRPGGGHYDAAGNAAAFAVLMRGLDEFCDLRPTVGGLPAPWAMVRAFESDGGLVEWSRGVAPPFDRVPSAGCLVLRARSRSPSMASYALGGLAKSFRAGAWAYEPEDLPGTFELVALLDGAEAHRVTLQAGEAPRPLELDLRGALELELRLEVHDSRGCVVLSDPVFE